MNAVPSTAPKYSHECSEWDFLLIDETCDEFHCCTCFQPTPELLEIQDKICVKLDLLRGGA